MTDIFDQELDPNVQVLADDGFNRAPYVDQAILWLGTNAITATGTFRFEIRQTGIVPMFELANFPAPAVVVAFEVNDPEAFIGAIFKLPDGDLYFMFSAGSAISKVYKWDGTTLSVDDSPNLGSTTPILINHQEELFACYTNAIRKRNASGVWGDATTPVVTGFEVVGAYKLLDKVFFIVNANYVGVNKAEVWTYNGSGNIVLDKSYTGTSAIWNRSSNVDGLQGKAGGIFEAYLYASWDTNDGAGVSTLVKSSGDGTWTNVRTLEIGQIVEFRGEIFGQIDGTLLSPGSNPAGTWAEISDVFGQELVVF